MDGAAVVAAEVLAIALRAQALLAQCLEAGGPAFEPRPGAVAPDLGDAAFQERFRRRPVKRAKRRGLLRNVAVTLGNAAHSRQRPLLERRAGDDDPVVREHAAWGLRRLDARLCSG